MKIVLFGAGVLARELVRFDFSNSIVALADNDSGKHGASFSGVPVIPPPEIASWEPDRVVLTVREPHQSHMLIQLEELGLSDKVGELPPEMALCLAHAVADGGKLDLAALRCRLHGNAPKAPILERFAALTDLASYVLPEYRFKWPSMDWWKDAEFSRFLASFNDNFNGDRKWNLEQLLRIVQGVPGDTAEVGVFEGASSWLIARWNQGRRQHYIFDSFEGLSQPGEEDGGHWKPGDLSAPEELVRARLAAFEPHFTLIKGWVPERFPEVDDRRFAFVHIDVDLFQPTFDSIRFFYERMSPGGVILCDDYGFDSCPGATMACDRFLADKIEKMVALADGGGFMIKGVVTSA